MRSIYTYRKFLESVESKIINSIEFPEIFNLDGFITALKDDGYDYTIKNLFKKFVKYPFNRNLFLSSISTINIISKEDSFYYSTEIDIDIDKDENVDDLEALIDNFKVDLEDDFYFFSTREDFFYRIVIQYKEPIPILDWYKQFYEDIGKSLEENNLNTHNLKFNDIATISYELSSFYPVKPIDSVIKFRYELAILNLRKKWNFTNEYYGRTQRGGEKYNLVLKIANII